MEVKTFIVEGMSCKNCKAHVERDIQGITGVDDVIADLATGEVKVSGMKISEEEIKSSVEAGGYEFRGEV
jgi:copper chaperone CopZ